MAKLNFEDCDILVLYDYLQKNIDNQYWWKDQKKLLKGFKAFKKLNLDKLVESAQSGDKKSTKKVTKHLHSWCQTFLNKRQWKEFKDSLNQVMPSPKKAAKHSIKVSEEAYTLLQKISKKQKQSVSKVIINALKTGEIPVLTRVVEEPSVGKEPSAGKEPSTDKKSSKGQASNKAESTQVVDVQKSAAGQCQAMTSSSGLRCRRRTTDLSTLKQVKDGVTYMFSVCHTHNKPTTEVHPDCLEN